jgi:cation diffusion facilitator CzcD-associated flavoprotein CzcO
MMVVMLAQVGFGNSAGEIALDLADHGAQPVLLIRKPKAIVIPKVGVGRIEYAEGGAGMWQLVPRLYLPNEQDGSTRPH